MPEMGKFSRVKEEVKLEDPEERVGGFPKEPFIEEADVLMELTYKNWELEAQVQDLEGEKEEQQASIVLFESLVMHTITKNMEMGHALYGTACQKKALGQENIILGH